MFNKYIYKNENHIFGILDYNFYVVLVLSYYLKNKFNSILKMKNLLLYYFLKVFLF